MKRLVCFAFCCAAIMSLGQFRVNAREQLSTITALAWSPDGTRIAFAESNGHIEIIDAASHDVISSPDLTFSSEYINLIVWSPDNQRIFVGAVYESALYDTRGGSRSFHLFANLHEDSHEAAKWSNDASLIAVLNADTILTAWIDIWDTRTGESLKSFPTMLDMSDMDWSPDNKAFAVSSYLSFTYTLDAGTGERLLELPNGPAKSVEWRPDKSLLATGELEGQICLWDAKSGEIVNALDTGSGFTTEASWSPDGQKIVATSLGEIVIWYVDQGRVLHLDDFDIDLASPVWNPDSTQIAFGTGGAIQIFDVPPSDSIPLEAVREVRVN